MNKTKLTSVIGVYLSFSISLCLGQSDSPSVDWKVNDIPHISPTTLIMQSNSTLPEFQPGVLLYDDSSPYPTRRSGEDWWYSVTPNVNGEGYFVSGYATWMYYNLNEVPAGGCKFNAAGGYDPERPVLQNENLSPKLATAGLYDKDGKMVWCRPYLSASEGGYSIKTDLDGNIVMTGWTSSIRDVFGNPINFNPENGSNGTDLAGALCDSNESKAFITKISPTGLHIWSYVYSMYDLNTPGFTDIDIVGFGATAYDIEVDNEGNYVVVGLQINRFNNKGGLFIFKVSPDGQLLKRTELKFGTSVCIPRSITYDNVENQFLVSGIIEEEEGRGHGFVAKFDSNLNPIGDNDFGNHSTIVDFFDGNIIQTFNIGLIWNENIEAENVSINNIMYDTKILSNNNIATVSADDCTICTYGTANLGVPFLRIYNSNGTNLDPVAHPTNEPIRINSNRDGYVKAFDMKLSFEPNDPNEITILATVADGDVGSVENLPIFQESMNTISNGSLTNISDFVVGGNYTPRNGDTSFPFRMDETSALLANYDINGNLNWEKVIDSDDAPLQPYPGDWKEQECVYSVMKGVDGEYVFVGNTSHNKDDYFIAKVHGTCNLDLDYDVAPIDPVTNNIINIDGGGIVNWNPSVFNGQSDINVRGEIHVKSGTLLQISGGLTVHFADYSKMEIPTKLIIEPGARLRVNNATLTSTNCPNSIWYGVEIWGNTNLPQTSTNQGFVELISATVSNAYEAFQVWKPNDWNSTGGILRATNTNFIDNQRSAEFIAYSNILNNVERANISNFNNCVFKTTNNYLSNRTKNHISMFMVSGINISGCDFSDERSVISNASDRGKGIFSIDAKYKVLGRFNGTTPTLHQYYDQTNYDICTFTNLASGVEAMNGNSQNTITVDHSLFTDSRFGVKLNQVDNALVTRNRFETTPTGPLYASVYGAYLEKSSAYQVEGNIVENNKPNSVNVIGVSINNGGFENNQVYKNQLINTHYGTYSFSKNRNDEPASSQFYTGLEFLCNNHENNKNIDQLVFGFGELDGEKPVQGLVSNPARNVFTPDNGDVNFNIANYLDYDLFYIYNTLGDPNEFPALISSGVNLVAVGSPLIGCQTNFTTINPGGTGGVLSSGIVRSNLENQFNQIKSEHSLKVEEFNGLLANGDRDELHDAIANLAPNNKHATKTLLLQSSPFLSESILMEIADKAPGHFPNSWLIDIIEANVEITRNDEYLGFLLTKSQPIPQGLYNQIVQLKGNYTERTIKQHEIIGLDREAKIIANYILKDIVHDSSGFDLNYYNTWIAKRSDVLCEIQFVDNYLSKGLKDSCEVHLTKINQTISELTEGELKQELEDYNQFKRFMLKATNERGVLEGVTEETAIALRGFAQNLTGVAKNQAQNFLCFFLDECVEVPELPLFEDVKRSMQGEQSSERNNDLLKYSAISIYPNPSTKLLTIQLNDENIDEIQLFDVNGRLVLVDSIEEQLSTISIEHLQKGVYLVNFLFNGELVERKKMIKQ